MQGHGPLWDLFSAKTAQNLFEYWWLWEHIFFFLHFLQYTIMQQWPTYYFTRWQFHIYLKIILQANIIYTYAHHAHPMSIIVNAFFRQNFQSLSPLGEAKLKRTEVNMYCIWLDCLLLHKCPPHVYLHIKYIYKVRLCLSITYSLFTHLSLSDSTPAPGDLNPAVVLETLAISMVWIEREREGAREGVKHEEK